MSCEIPEYLSRERLNHMKFLSRMLLVALCLQFAIFPHSTRAQNNAQKPDNKPAAASDDADKNLQSYIELLREDVRQQKAEIMGSVMALSAADAAKFWPIYEQYDAELTKLNDQRAENIKEYARVYLQLTDEKADELIQKSLTYQKQRAELLAKTYDQVKQAVGAITAARFAQIEHQLLLIIDLKIASALPVAEPAS
jgi:hypothetical protein